jgi:hypothetical protein
MVLQYRCQRVIGQSILLIFIAFIEIRIFLGTKKVTFFVTVE